MKIQAFQVLTLGLLLLQTIDSLSSTGRHLVFLLTNTANLVPLGSLRIQGTFHTDDFFSVITKFGFSKTDMSRPQVSQSGFIFGNITQKNQEGVQKQQQESVPFPAVLAVLDRGYFLEYYGNRSVFNKSLACSLMFSKVSQIAYHSKCLDNGTEDFLRSVPCPSDELCLEEDRVNNVVEGSQLTYRIVDVLQSRFWYTSLVSCYRNTTTCRWEHYTGPDVELEYDLQWVNGNPRAGDRKLLEYQFSYDQQNLLGLYVLFLVVYTVMVAVQCRATTKQQHPITRLLMTGVVLDFIALASISTHTVKFSLDGLGFPYLDIFGDICDIMSRTVFMLLLLLLAKGWAVTRLELLGATPLFVTWACYGLVHILLYIWNRTEVDVIEDIDEYETVPGWAILVFRLMIMAWFTVSLKHTMELEQDISKSQFFLHFGAASLVWFIYLPLVALLALQVSALWRSKLILGLTYSADTFAYAVLMHLLWPTRSRQYFLLATKVDNTEELDHFSEAPTNLSRNSAESREGKVFIVDRNDNNTSGGSDQELGKIFTLDRNDNNTSGGSDQEPLVMLQGDRECSTEEEIIPELL